MEWDTSVIDLESEDEDKEGKEEVHRQYAKRREENIAKNKLILENLFANSTLLPKFKPGKMSNKISLENAPQHESRKQHDKQSLIDGFFSNRRLAEMSSGSPNKNSEPPENSDFESPSLHDTFDVRDDSLSVTGQPVSENTKTLSVIDLNNTSNIINKPLSMNGSMSVSDNTNSPSAYDLHDTSKDSPSIILPAESCDIHEDSSKDTDMADSTRDGMDSAEDTHMAKDKDTDIANSTCDGMDCSKDTDMGDSACNGIDCPKDTDMVNSTRDGMYLTLALKWT